MAKYSTEFKMKVIKEYLEGKIGYKELAKNIVYLISVLFKHGSVQTRLKVMMDKSIKKK